MYLNSKLVIERLNRVIRDRIKPFVDEKVSNCKVSVFHLPGEPIEPKEAIKKTYKPFEFGKYWGKPWSTSWFKIKGEVPKNTKSKKDIFELVVDLGWTENSFGGESEGMLYRKDATVVKGINPQNNWIRLQGPGAIENILDKDNKFELYIEAASNPIVLGVPPFIRQMSNFGFSPDNKIAKKLYPKTNCYKLNSIKVTKFNHELYGLYMDLSILLGLTDSIDKKSVQFARIIKSIENCLNVYDEKQLDKTLHKAKYELKSVLKDSHTNASSINVTAVGNSHIDSAWLWPYRETKRKVGRTVSNALAMQKIYPKYKYAMSAAHLVEWLEIHYPNIFDQFKKAVKDGKIIPVGGTWLEFDAVIPSGESLIRQMVYGKRYYREKLNFDTNIIWLPDSFGYSSAIPQIAIKSGFKYFLTQKISWNDTNVFPHDSFFWEGIDGTKLLTHFPPSDTYSASVNGFEVKASQDCYSEKAISKNAMFLYGFGDGGGGPTREMQEKIERLENVESMPNIKFQSPEKFFKELEKETKNNKFPVWSKELYLEYHRGTLTSQHKMKEGIRTIEALFRVVEFLCTVKFLENPKFEYPHVLLEKLWKDALLLQFHDVLPGTSIEWVHKESKQMYKNIIEQLTKLLDKCTDKTGKDVKVYPSTSGNIVISDARDAINEIEIKKRGRKYLLENDFLKVIVNEHGYVSSIKYNNNEIVNEKFGYFGYGKDTPINWDAWDLDKHVVDNLEEIKNPTNIKIENNGLKITYQIEESKIDLFLTVVGKKIKYSIDIDWNADEKYLRLIFDTNLRTKNGIYETQYGYIERPAADNTSWDDIQFEASNHRWVLFGDSETKIGIANKTSYGGIIKRKENKGTTANISLLRAAKFPDNTQDIEKHHFEYEVLIGSSVKETTNSAIGLNAPKIKSPSVLSDKTPIELNIISGSAVIDWVKLADDSSGDIIVRIYEPNNSTAAFEIDGSVKKLYKKVVEVHTLEDGKIEVCKNIIKLNPFEFKTLRFSK